MASIAAVFMLRDKEDVPPGSLAHALARFDMVLAVERPSRNATPAILDGAQATRLGRDACRMDGDAGRMRRSGMTARDPHRA